MRLQTPSAAAARALFVEIDDALTAAAHEKRRPPRHLDLAQQHCVSLSRVKNLARLSNELEAPIKDMIRGGHLSPSHAELLLGLEPAARKHHATAARLKRLTVAELRAAIAGRSSQSSDAPDANVAALEQELGELLGTSIRIEVGAPSARPPRPGQLVAEFWSNDELEGILDVIRLGKMALMRRRAV